MSVFATNALTLGLSGVFAGQRWISYKETLTRRRAVTDEVTHFSTPEATSARALGTGDTLLPTFAPAMLFPLRRSGRLRRFSWALFSRVTSGGLLPLLKCNDRLMALHMRYSGSGSLIITQQFRLCAQCPIGLRATDQLMASRLQNRP